MNSLLPWIVIVGAALAGCGLYLYQRLGAPADKGEIDDALASDDGTVAATTAAVTSAAIGASDCSSSSSSVV